MKTRTLFIALIFSFLTTNAQDIPIGQWRAHLPYGRAIGVKVMGDEVYCLTTRSLFIYDRKTGEIETISKLDGLSGNLFSALGYNEAQKCIIIGHEDGAIDLIKNNEIVNVPDIKNSEVVNIKKINRIVCSGKYAYLCCEFGVVVFDIEREEVKETYLMPVNVWDFTEDGKNFYAATDDGIFYTAKNNKEITFFKSWTPMAMPDSVKKCVAINYWNGKLIYYLETGSNSIYTQTPLEDDCTVLRSSIYNPGGGKVNITISNDRLLICSYQHVSIYTESYESYRSIRDVNLGDTIQRVNPTQAFYVGNNQYFIADYNVGLIFVKNMANMSGEAIEPNGPHSHRSFSMTTDGTKVWVVAGGHDDFWASSWIRDGLYCFDGYSWRSFNYRNGVFPDTIRDFSSIVIHPQNKDRLYIGTWGCGLVEMDNGVLVNVFDASNSPLEKRFEAPSQGEFVAGVAFDSKGLLWVANSNASNLLLTYDKAGIWTSHYLGVRFSRREVEKLMIDRYDNKWLLDRSGVLIVYNEKNGGTVREIGAAAGLNDRPFSIAEDKNGNLWVGTRDGVYIIRNTYNILASNNGSFYPVSIDRPKLTMGGHVDYLLKGETIVHITVNGANEKWCLSNKQGVYKITSEGTSEIFHLTAQNSPLFSNNMLSSCITNNGEVFMATEQGIVSYRDEATKGTATNSNVYAFPNPVKPDYQGIIAINGVVDMAEIKITDVAGNIVYSTRAKGGQGIWDAKDFNGKRVATGVYIVFITNEDGTETTVTKIMVLN